MANVDVVSGLSGLCVSGGRLNAYKALNNVARHTFTYTNRGVNFGHLSTCTLCNFSIVEEHVWQYVATMYRCIRCNATSSYIPEQM